MLRMAERNPLLQTTVWTPWRRPTGIGVWRFRWQVTRSGWLGEERGERRVRNRISSAAHLADKRVRTKRYPVRSISVASRLLLPLKILVLYLDSGFSVQDERTAGIPGSSDGDSTQPCP